MDAETVKKPHRFQPGQSGNPQGRRKGSKNLDGLLTQALQLVQQQRAQLKSPCTCVLKWGEDITCATLDQHFLRMAFFDPSILVAVQKKRIPDLQQQTGDAQRPSAIYFVNNYRPMPAAHG